MSLSPVFADISVLSLGFRLIVSLGIVLAAIWALTWAARRRNGFGLAFGATPGPIVVRARESLTRTSTVALLEVGDRALLVGVTEQHVELLAEGRDLLTPEPDVDDDATGSGFAIGDRTSPDADPDGSASPGMNLMETLREWSVRRS